MHKITVRYFDPADGDDFESAYRERHVPSDEPNEGPLVEPGQDRVPPGEDPADDPSPEPDLV